ncbi:formate/nitrite transporter [Spiroplasma syrphidicola EA-1]|uniref:Formate/nitrite transporter n=1 Tax=Spiroplasma syrphidicola EA-1 TaxID=1276229 RepID=R4ULR2_9MOLU|nr:formate/nitrite transporter family protein [Spiroplasma syrphidicola]AGM26141.1 formate/nitrite transporter [Spiroplasma syrphidicola EA-1]
MSNTQETKGEQPSNKLVIESDHFTNEQTFTEIYKYTLKKAKNSFFKTFLMGLAAGLFIGFGYIASIMATRGDWSNLPVGLKSFVFGITFTVAIVMIIFLGGELFTSNSMICLAVVKRQVSVHRFVLNLTFVLLGNILGCAILAIITYFAGFLKSADFLNNTVGMIESKLDHTWYENFASAILCNFLVAGSVYAAHSTKNTAGKFFLVVIIIMAFAISGFSHVVANCYLWAIQPFLGIYGNSAGSWQNFLKFGYTIQLPTLFGNFLSGGIFLPFLYYFIFRKDIPAKITL